MPRLALGAGEGFIPLFILGAAVLGGSPYVGGSKHPWQAPKKEQLMRRNTFRSKTHAEGHAGSGAVGQLALKILSSAATATQSSPVDIVMIPCHSSCALCEQVYRKSTTAQQGSKRRCTAQCLVHRANARWRSLRQLSNISSHALQTIK
ncbi:hypothetical protein T492DRAFT_840837 [Pavlovales sp. CCMP2436]|nr:hypothetical protein T492DRAFT_840837 [Pavlovales sp. CCMP2436]